jgi:hypothetical protein
MANKQILVVTAVKLSEDKRRAFLSITGLGPKTVVAIKVVGVKSSTGEDLYRPGSWYTLNSISTADFNAAAGINPKNVLPKMVYLSSQIQLHRSSLGLMLSLPFAEEYVLTLRSANGRILESYRSQGPKQFQLGSQSMASGLYLLDVAISSQVLHKRIIY